MPTAAPASSPGPRTTASAGPSEPPPAGPSPIREENARTGNAAWQAALFSSASIRGFLDRISAAPGDSVGLRASGRGPFEVHWYRLGWYGGAGGRPVRVDRNLVARSGRTAPPDPASGLVEEAWPEALRFEVPVDWPSGVYLAALVPSAGAPGCAVLIVRRGPDARTAPVLFVSAQATWQAYNEYGGTSFYGARPIGPYTGLGGERAIQVGFDRPYGEYGGAGYLPRWEAAFVRWQEREGRDLDYCADIDLELNPEIAGGRRLLVFAGHHEYWSRPMRETLEAAIAAGSNVAFLAANSVYWQMRLEPSLLGAGRRMTCWKSAARDPVAATTSSLATCRWREPPVRQPEAALIGQMYGNPVRVPADWVVTNPGHWLYEGTGVREGDRFINLVGQEYDTYVERLAPAGTLLWARGPVQAETRRPGNGIGDIPTPAVHTATVYQATSGATVVAAGTFQWSWALDDFGQHAYRGRITPLDDRVARITRNLFSRLGDG